MAVLAGGLAGAGALHGEVTAESLVKSVESDAGSAATLISGLRGACRRTARPRERRCEVADSSGSGSGAYRVRVRRGSSCWDGVLTDSPAGGALDPRISGCVRRLNLL